MKSVTHPISNERRQSGGALRRLLSTYRTEIAIAIAIIVIELAVGMIVPAALSGGNISNVTQAAAPLVIMAFGVLLVIITGGIDLSVGSVFSLTGMVTGLAMAHGYGAVREQCRGPVGRTRDRRAQRRARDVRRTGAVRGDAEHVCDCRQPLLHRHGWPLAADFRSQLLAARIRAR